jgi:tetratricopeptide (TPR) repeat protein
MILAAVLILCGLLGFLAWREARERYFFPTRMKRAEKLFADGQVESALALIKPMEARYKNSSAFLWIKGRCEARQNQYLLAIVTFNDLLRGEHFTEGITEEMVRRELAAVYEKSGRKREALTEYFLLTEKNPGYYEGNLKVGRFHLDKKSYPEAERFLKQAHLANRDAEEPAMSLARLYQETGRTPQAELYLKAILQRQPQHEEALYRQGLVLLDRREVESARDLFRAAQALDGELAAEAMVREAFCEIHLGNFEAALRLLESACPNLPDGQPLLHEALEEQVRLYVNLRQFENLEDPIRRHSQAFPQEAWSSQKRDLFRHLLVNPDVRELFGGSNADILRRIRQFLEQRNYSLEEQKILTDNLIYLRMIKQQKGFQKQHEIFYISLLPELVGKSQMLEWTKTMKQDQVRTLIAITPFDFTAECQVYVKPMSVVLIPGDKVHQMLSGAFEF